MGRKAKDPEYSEFIEKSFSGNIELYQKDAPSPYDAFDENNPFCLKRVVREPLLLAALEDKKVNEYFKLSEEEIVEKLKPTLLLKRLRTSFWLHYEQVIYNIREGKSGAHLFGIKHIVSGICTIPYFQQTICKNPLAVNYILRIAPDYFANLNEALNQSVARMREILDLPIFKMRIYEGQPVQDPEGAYVYDIDYKTADLIIKVYAMLDLRVKGAVPQKLNIDGMIKKQSASVNLNISKDEAAKKILTVEDLDSRLAELSMEIHDVIENPPVEQIEMTLKKRQEALTEQRLNLEKEKFRDN